MQHSDGGFCRTVPDTGGAFVWGLLSGGFRPGDYVLEAYVRFRCTVAAVRSNIHFNFTVVLSLVIIY